MWSFNTPYSNELKHYASPYYDPVKAHEYYEEHKKLKGRSTSSDLDDKGQEIDTYVKKSITEERDAKLKTAGQNYSSKMQEKSKQHQNSVKQHAKILNERIDSLRRALKRMSPADRQEQAPKIKAIITKLRKQNDEKRSQLEARYKAESRSIQDEHKQLNQNINDYAAQEYSREHEKIAQEYTAAKKRR